MNKVAESLQQIVAHARKVDALVAEIATASNEQSQGIGQVNTAVSQMDKVTQSNAANAEETAAAAEELNSQSLMLKDAVGQLQALTGLTTTAASSQPVKSPATGRVKSRELTPPRPVTVVKTKPASPLAPLVAVAAGDHQDFFQDS